jgi:hypothetical protein
MVLRAAGHRLPQFPPEGVLRDSHLSLRHCGQKGIAFDSAQGRLSTARMILFENHPLRSGRQLAGGLRVGILIVLEIKLVLKVKT